MPWRERRSWTAKEDRLLREAIAKEGPDNPNTSKQEMPHHAKELDLPNLRTITDIAGSQNNYEHFLNVAGSRNTVTVNDHRVIYVNVTEHSARSLLPTQDFLQLFHEHFAQTDAMRANRTSVERTEDSIFNQGSTSYSRSPIAENLEDGLFGNNFVPNPFLLLLMPAPFLPSSYVILLCRLQHKAMIIWFGRIRMPHSVDHLVRGVLIQGVVTLIPSHFECSKSGTTL
ncbi:hypothetical protein AN958_11881 [Leucoagaricus sp. SymC.cos]|nr:hypothetical protein AN958_11881 [Leucoagaricus sp. SymC.cos]